MKSLALRQVRHLSTETSTTPGEALYSNGIVERNNAVIYESMMKTKEDVKCSFETALAWAVSAKNALQNVYGFSPNQLVFGCNVNLPSVLSSQLPALDPVCSSDLVCKNLNAMHRARENFVKAESSERIMKAPPHQVRIYSEEEFTNGDKVYYQARRGRKGWRGPAKVLGKERNFVLIRHGDAYYRCHPCQLLKIPDTAGINHSDIGNAEGDVQKSVSKDVKTVANDSESDSDEQFGFDTEENELVEGTPEISEDEQVDTDQNQHGNQETDVEERTVDGAGNSSHVDLPDKVKEIQNDYEGDVGDENMIEQMFDAKTRPKVNSMVQFMMPDGEIKKARVLCNQPKRSGRSKDWLNVKLVRSDDPSSVDWSRISGGEK